MKPMNPISLRKSAGLTGIIFFLVHAGALILAGEHHHLLWCCHLGCLLVGTGLFLPNRWIYGVGSAWLVLGVPLWLLNVLVSREFMPTSLLSHLGGLLLALYGLRHIEIPRFLWMAATLAMLVLAVATRYLTPQSENINLAFSVWTGWEEIFPSYFRYGCMMLALAALIFFLFEKLALNYQQKRF